MIWIAIKDRCAAWLERIVLIAIGAILMLAHLGKAESCDQLDVAKVAALENTIIQHQRYEALLEWKVKRLEASTLRIQLASRPVIQEVRVEPEPITVAQPVVVSPVEPITVEAAMAKKSLVDLAKARLWEAARVLNFAPKVP